MADIYNITYELLIADTNISILDDSSFDGISLNSVFGEDRLSIIENNSFYFNVTIDARCTAEIYWNDEKISNEDVNEGWSLGHEVSYIVKNRINADKGPSELKLRYTAFRNDVYEDYHILVILKVVDRHPVFNAIEALKTDNLKGRGSTGTDEGPDYMSGNIKTADNWGWNSNSSIIDKQTIPMTKLEDGSYSWSWVWQTNTGGYVLDSFIVNGTACTVPFVPTLYYDTKETSPTDMSTKTTILPSGAKVTIEMVRSFNNNSQRVYKVDFTNVYVDMVLTAANLMSGTGADEVVIYSLSNIKNGAVFFNNTEYLLGDVITAPEWGDKSLGFYVKSLCENPEVSVKDIYGNNLSTVEDAELLDNGYYYIPFINTEGMDKFALLYVKANFMLFYVLYNSGEVSNAKFPEILNWVDDNNGNYYTIENSSIVRIYNEVPIDLDNNKVFDCWYVNNVKIKAGLIFYLSDFSKYATKVDNTYAINLTASWKNK